MTQSARVILSCSACCSMVLLSGTAMLASPVTPVGRWAEGLEGVVWRLTRVTPKPRIVPATGATEDAARESRIDIFFQDGRVSGSSGCNAYTGSYELDGTALRLGPLASTRKACPPALMNAEADYLAILKTVDTVALTGDTLRLSGAAGELGFVSEGQPTLTGAWAMTGYNNGKQAVVSKKSGTTVTASFGDGDRVSGSSGCNTFSGLFEVTGGDVSIGPLVSTQKMCPDADLMSQERLYLKALQAATTFELRGDTLTLRDGDGAMQVTFTRQPSTPK